MKWTYLIGLECVSSGKFHSLLPSKQDLNAFHWILEIRSVINSDIIRGQTDICCCCLPELPPLTQTGLVPKWSIFPPKVTVSRLILVPKLGNHALARARFAIFDVLAGKLAWKLGFLVPNQFELKEATQAKNSNKCLFVLGWYQSLWLT